MLSGEGNENGEKTTIGLIAKTQLCTCMQNTFFVHFSAVVSHDKLPSNTFYRGNVVRFLVHFLIHYS